MSHSPKSFCLCALYLNKMRMHQAASRACRLEQPGIQPPSFQFMDDLCYNPVPQKVNQLESNYKFKVYKLVKLVSRLEQNTLKPYSLTRTLEHFLTAYPAHVSKLSSGHFWGIVHAVHLLVNQGECHSRSLALRSFNWLESPGKISWPWGQKNIQWAGSFYSRIMRGNSAGSVWFRLPSLYKCSNLDIWVIGWVSECRDLGWGIVPQDLAALRFQQEMD